MMKKIVSLLMVMLCCTLSMSALAVDTNGEEDNVNAQQEIAISVIPAEMAAAHERIINSPAGSAGVRTMDEYEALQAAQNMSENELLQEGYSVDEIADIQDGTAAERLREGIFERAELSPEQLSNMGYSEDEIVAMKSLTGEETLAELSAIGATASCTTYNTFVSHTYRTATGKTYFICGFGWEWDKPPIQQTTDCIGIGWNHDFHPDYGEDSEYNVCYITYVNPNNELDRKYTQSRIYEKQLQTAEYQFSMNYSGTGFYAKSGFGYMCLSQTGQINDVKMAFKYGHSFGSIAPSVGYPWGVSFGFSSAEAVYQPRELVYHDFPAIS